MEPFATGEYLVRRNRYIGQGNGAQPAEQQPYR